MKYAIAALRKISAAEGAMGKRMQVDSVWNVFVNTKGRYSMLSMMLCPAATLPPCRPVTLPPCQ